MSRRSRADSQSLRSKIKSKEDRYVEKHHQGSTKITRKEFMKLITKSAQPISEWNKPVQEAKGTSEPRPSDGCSETHTNQDKSEGKED